MSAPAPERPGAVEAVAALVLAHAAFRESLLERAVETVMQVLWLFRFGVLDEPEAFAEVSDTVRNARAELREATVAHNREVFAQYGEDFPPGEVVEDQFEVDEEFWSDLTAKATAAVDTASQREGIDPRLLGETPGGGETNPLPVYDGNRPVEDLFEDFVDSPDGDGVVREWLLPGEIVIDPDVDDPELEELFERTLEDLEKYLAEAAEEAEREARKGDGSKVIGYRRVPHPELSQGGTCGLCVAAAMNMYYRPNLKDLHSGCHCEVLPVTPDNDPAYDLNIMDGLASAYSQMNTTDGWALKQYRFEGSAGNLTMTQERKKSGPVKAREDRQEKAPRNSASEGLSDMTATELYDLIDVMSVRVSALRNPKDKQWSRKRLRAAQRERDRRGLPAKRKQ